MEDFHELLQKKIINEFKLRIEQSINKEEFFNIYNRAKELYEQEKGEKFLEPRKFAEIYLQLTVNAYKIVSGGYNGAKILKSYKIEEDQIQELRRKIIYEEKLHRGTLKSYAELLQYYNKYFIPLKEPDFFEKLLDVSCFCLRNIQPKKSKEINTNYCNEENKNEEKKISKTEILKNEIVLDEEIERIRKEVLTKELLHKNDKINYKKFLEIYQKYFIPLSEEEFAQKILDISKKAYRKIKFYPETGAIILSSIQIPENIEQIREEIIRKETLHRKDEISYERFNEILDNNYLSISRYDFAKLILDVSADTLRTVKQKKTKINILTNQKYPSKEEIYNIRKKVIQTCKLHKNDKITYNQFLNIYNDKRFYISLTEEEFAKEILDMEYNAYKEIRYALKDSVRILKKEQVNQEEIESLRKQILQEFKIGQKIDYDELEYIYNKYYIRLSLKEYAKRVLEIQSRIKDLKNKKYEKEDPENPEKKIVTKMKTMIFSKEELEKLKNNIINSNNLYNGMELTRQHFMKLYKNYSHSFSYTMFGKFVLGIELPKVNALILGRARKVRIATELSPDINESNKEQFLRDQENRIEELLYEGKLPNEIADDLMISEYDISQKINKVNLSRKINKDKVEKARVKRKLFSDTKFYKIPIQLHMNIDDVKKLSVMIIAEEIQRYMIENGLTFNEATEMVSNELLEIRGKKKIEEPKEQNQTNKEIRDEKRKKLLKARVEKTIKEYNGSQQQNDTLNKFIRLCKLDIKNGEFNKEDIDVLEEAIFFVDKDDNNIQTFIRYCIEQGEYKRANGFLAYYLNNNCIEKSEKKILTELYKQIKVAQEKSYASRLILNGSYEKDYVMKLTNVREVDVIKIEREIKGKVIEKIFRELI